MLSNQAQNSQIGWEAHGSRIIRAVFRTSEKKIKLNVIQCYAPTTTNEMDDEVKDSEKGVNILMGNFNGKIGEDNTEDVMGRHEIGDMSDNGEKF